MNPAAISSLKSLIRQWSLQLGFADCGFSNTDLNAYIPQLQQWLDKGYQGDMNWIEKALEQRQSPQLLVANTLSVISVRMNYLSPDTQPMQILNSPDSAYIARYALGRDYHKLMRKRIAQLGERIRHYVHHECADFELSQRPFVDSAPVLEKPFAEKAGLGWIGKNTLLINRNFGSWFFLGELYTNLQFEADHHSAQPVADECGKCKACMSICPTQAFPQPYVLNANRCIAYLTIEYKGIIDEELRPLMGNRVFGCDDCQLVCPWNRYAQSTQEDDFKPRHQFDNRSLIELFCWSKDEFLEKTAGSAIRRTGYECWQRNLAIGLGNGKPSVEAVNALKQRREGSSAMLLEHIDWAINQLSGEQH